MIIFALEGGTICARMENGSVRKALAVLGLILALFVMLPEMSNATVLLIGNNKSFTFDDLEANFVPPTKGSGLCGMLQVAEPSDACSPLRNKAVSGEGLNSPFALIQRGTCSFERKVRHAQDAGFKAAIVYNIEDNNDLVTMGGNSRSLMIYAVFVSKADGQILLRYAGNTNMECWIIPSLNTSWTVMVISFSALISMAALLAICVFLRKYWLRHGRRVNSHRHQLPAMSCRQVKALPSLIFISVTDDKCTSETCAICLEDYKAGEKLRVLPCCHKFHALCIDSWLTRWRTFCPVCKRDAKTVTVEPPVTENTPLLSASSLISSQSQAPQSSFIGSPSMHGFSNLSRNVANIGNTSLVSLGIQSSVFSSQSSLCASPQMDSSFTLPQQMDSSFTLPQPILSCGGSVAVISPFNSTNSLPGYQECCV